MASSINLQADATLGTLTKAGDATGNLVLQTNGNSALTINTSQNITFNGTGAFTVPVGNTAQRPSPAANGMIRYNTEGGIYYVPNVYPRVPAPDQSKSLRANYAGIGYTYDDINDVFYAPRSYASWSISAPTWLWTAPIPYSTDGGLYYWDEATLSWVETIL